LFNLTSISIFVLRSSNTYTMQQLFETSLDGITKDSGIYYLKINELNYVGSSVSIKTRLLEHKNKLLKNKHENSRMQNTFNKHGSAKCYFSVLYAELNISKEKLLELEKEWIDLLGPVLNNKLDPTTQYNSGSNSKTVYQFTLHGQKVAEYPSTKEAQRQTKISASSIIQVCNSKLKSAGGYLWSYNKNAEVTYDLQRSKWKWIGVTMINSEGITSEFKNIATAARSIFEEGDNFDSLCASISSVCNNKGKLVKGKYRFKKGIAILKQGELLGTPTDGSEDNQQPSLSSNTLEGSTTNSQVLPSNVEDSNANTSALPTSSNKDVWKYVCKDCGDDIV